MSHHLRGQKALEEKPHLGAPGWLTQVVVRLLILLIQAPCRAPCGACLEFSLPLPVPLCSHCLSLSQKNKWVFFSNVALFLKELDQVRAGEGQREKETENPKQYPSSELRAVSPEPDAGLEFMNHETVTRAKVRCLTN